MNPLFYVMIALFSGAIAVTVHAVLSAPEGYEDGAGFHPIRRRAVARKRRSGRRTSVHPYFSAR